MTGYQRSMDEGYRCIELDVWNGDNGHPIIKHGYCLVTEMLFEAVIKYLSENCFKNNKNPLILSLEMHCNEG